MKNLASILFALLLVVFTLPQLSVNAQTETSTTDDFVSEHIGYFYIIQTVDGIEYLGKVIQDDGREVWIVDERLGLVVLQKNTITEMIRLDIDTDLSIGENYVPKGAFTTRNIFTTNAFPIEKGKHYAMFNLFGPEAHFAVNDKFNLGVMSTWIGSPISLVTKYSFSEEEAPVKVALGGLLGNSGYLDLFATSGGLGFITFTTGTRQNNVSLSLGYGFMSNSIDYLEAGTYTIIDYGSYYSNNFERDIMNYNDVDLTKGKQTVSGPILSLACAVKIGRNSSIVFDSMFGSFSQTSSSMTEVTNVSEGTVVQGMNGYYSYDLTVETSAVEVDKYKAALFMPGVRIQRSDSKAFQFAVAGIAFTENGDLTAFPIPMVTWFRGFN